MGDKLTICDGCTIARARPQRDDLYCMLVCHRAYELGQKSVTDTKNGEAYRQGCEQGVADERAKHEAIKG